MGYDYAMDQFYKMSPTEFEQIPPCDPSMVCTENMREFNKIKTKEQRLLYELCWSLDSISRFQPLYTVRKGGQAILIKARDHKRDLDVALKVPLPHFRHNVTLALEEGSIEIAPDRKATIEKGIACLIKRVVSMESSGDRRERLLKERQKALQQKTKEQLAEEAEQKKEFARSSQYFRFRRDFILQDVVYRAANKVDPNHLYGFVPATYDFGFHPTCYYTMAWVEGISYLEYLRTHNDKENLELFLKLVIFTEVACHNYGVAHCDINHRNVLVVGDVPVLVDFGVAWSSTLEAITSPGVVMGSLDYAPPILMTDARLRGFGVDVYELGCLLWVTMTRQPVSDLIFVQRDESGKPIYSEELGEHIASLYAPSAISDLRYRDIFEKCRLSEGGFNTISELRMALEASIFPEKPSVSCTEPCRRLLELEAAFIIMGEAFKMRPSLRKLKPPSVN